MAVFSRNAPENTVSVAEMAHSMAVTTEWLLRNVHRLNIPTAGADTAGPRFDPVEVERWLRRYMHTHPRLRRQEADVR